MLIPRSSQILDTPLHPESKVPKENLWRSIQLNILDRVTTMPSRRPRSVVASVETIHIRAWLSAQVVAAS